MSTLQKRFFTFKKYSPCNVCTKYCTKDQLTCSVCKKLFHRECINVSKKNYQSYESKNFICSKRCFNSEMPFFSVDNIDFMSYMFGDGKYPCAKCKRDCVDQIACISCSVCQKWFHHSCTNLTNKEFYNYYFFCSSACEMCLYPFNSCSFDVLVKEEICSVVKSKLNDPVQPKNTSGAPRPKVETKTKVNYNPFIDINCSYLKPKDLKNDLFGKDNSGFSIFHNNVRSVNKNLMDVKEIFRKCDVIPTIIAITETKHNSSTALPEMTGYDFENINSCTSAGGVGIFILKKFDYSIRNDLKLGVRECEDIWVEIKLNENSDNKKKKSQCIIVGLIYRHPKPQYAEFSDALEKNLTTLSQKNSKTIIVGDLNIDLMKFNSERKITDYVDLITSHGFNLCVDKPTTVTTHSSTCIDHVYSNISTEDIETIILESDVSDHYSTLTKISGLHTKNENKDIYHRKTNLSDEQWTLFKSELQYNLACNLTL